MAINTDYSFQFIGDTRTRISAGMATTVALGALAILVTLTYFQYLPQITYPISGGVALSIVLIGALIATLRQKPIELPPNLEPSKILNEFSAPPGEVLLPNTSYKAEIAPIEEVQPSLDEAMKTATKVSVHPESISNYPPSELYPFPTTDFTMKLTVDGKQWSYVVPVAHFTKEGDCVKAIFFHNQTQCHIVVHEERGGGSDRWGSCWFFEGAPRVEHLNGNIQCPGYISLNKAWESYSNIKSNQVALYFAYGTRMTGKNTGTMFRIPGLLPPELQAVTFQGTIVTFTRDPSIPLVPPEQINLLKSSSLKWHQKLALQLENPVWSYDIGRHILSIDRKGDEITVYTPSAFDN